jgi:hypothetical protein
LRETLDAADFVLIPAEIAAKPPTCARYRPEKIIEKGTPMSQVMIVVEFEVKPEHRSQFIDLMRGHAERSRR